MYRHRQAQQQSHPAVAPPHYPRFPAPPAMVSRSTVTEYSIRAKPKPVQSAPVLPPPRPPTAAGGSRTTGSSAATAAAPAVSSSEALARFDFQDEQQEQLQPRFSHVAKPFVRSSTASKASHAGALQSQQRPRRAAAHVLGSTPSPVRHHERGIKPVAAPIATHVKTLSLSSPARRQQRPAPSRPASPPAVQPQPTQRAEPSDPAGSDANRHSHRKRQAETEPEQAAEQGEQQRLGLEEISGTKPAARRAPSQKRLRYDAAVALAMQRSLSIPAPRSTRNSQRATAEPCSAPSPASSAPAAAAATAAAPALGSVQENDDYCAACGHAGRLLCCLRCVQAFHFSCLNMAEFSSIDDVPDSWTCADASSRSCTSRTMARRDSDQPADDESVTQPYCDAAGRARRPLLTRSLPVSLCCPGARLSGGCPRPCVAAGRVITRPSSAGWSRTKWATCCPSRRRAATG